MIETFSLTRHYGRCVAVDDVSLRIADGETFGFLGLNGAGKTTVMRMLAGLLRPTRGHTRVGGVDVRGPADMQRLIGVLSFVSQEMRFYERATLHELLRVYAALAGVPPDRGIAFARQAGVPLDRACARLSPGQQRKAQLAIALLKEPRYLLLDEPTAGLDPQGVAELRDVVRALHAGGCTVFLSSHVLGEVQALCTSVGILHQGRLCYQSCVEEAYVIGIPGDGAHAAALLRDAGIAAVPAPGGVRVAVSQPDLPAVIERLVAQGMRTGLVQAASLEEIFQQVLQRSEVTA
jgi:ABC-2 type transport system ATP-binding protein